MMHLHLQGPASLGIPPLLTPVAPAGSAASSGAAGGPVASSLSAPVDVWARGGGPRAGAGPGAGAGAGGPGAKPKAAGKAGFAAKLGVQTVFGACVGQ